MTTDKISQYLIDVSDYIKILSSLGSGTYGNIATFGSKNNETAKFAGKEYNMDNEQALSYFLREIYILTSDYPTILQLKGWSVIDKVIVMLDLMQKGSLYNIIHENDPELTPTNKQIILYGISKGMEYLHSKNIINRDLNPSNILLDDNLHPKITDFNFSKFTSNILDTNQSQSYPIDIHRAPEMNKNNYNAKVDVYSFGVIFYELIIDKILQRRQEIIFQDEKVPPNFMHQIEECLTDDFEKRPSFKEISEFLRTNFLPDVDEDEFQKYVKELDDFKSDDTLIEMPKEDDLYDHFYNLGLNQKKEPKKDLFKAANLFKVAAGLCRKKLNEASDDKVQQVNKDALEEYKKALEELGRKDEEKILSIKLYNQNQKQQENPNNQSSAMNNGSKKLFCIFDDFFSFTPDYSYEIKAIFYICQIEYNSLVVQDRTALKKYTIQLKYHQKNGDLPYEENSIFRKGSFVVSEKLIVTNQIYKIDIDIKSSDIKYIRYPTFNEFIKLGIITNFQSIPRLNLNDNDPISIIAAVIKDSYEENKIKERQDTYVRVEIIDAFHEKMTTVLFESSKEQLKNILMDPNFNFSKPILFQNVFVNCTCGIFSIKATNDSNIIEIENDFLSNIYDESFAKARKGKHYRYLYVNPEPILTIQKLAQVNKDDNAKTYEVTGRINSIELKEKGIEYVHLDQNIYHKSKNIKGIVDSEGKYHCVDKGENGDQSLEMIPNITLSVEIADLDNSDLTIKALTAVPEVVNYLLGRPVDDTSLSLFAQYGPKKKFRKNIEKYISENKKLNLTLRMILRIYNWGDINKYAIRIEKIIDNGDEMQKTNQLRTECKKEKDLEKKKELFKKSFNIFLNEEKNFYSFEARYQCALMCIEYEELKNLDEDKYDILNIDEISQILEDAAIINYQHDSAVRYYKFLKKNELDDHNKWEYMRMAAEKGCDKETQYKYGKYLYNQGRTDEGLKYIKKADENGYTKASNFLNQRIDKERNSKISPKD
ncbi:hypothetical protein M9Y10_006758 [Tritrichomonas musculus]|uniref:Protein kinase domain-containing protein n=1 Tax=Tritrichomonas musculus TaxID=1915356 RepID=A0ABR2JF12_9EUKA